MTHANNADNQNVELFAQDWAALNECALWTHEQGSLSALQEGLLKRIADVIVHRVSMFDIAQTGAHGQTQFVRPVAYGMSAQALDNYYERYAAYDYTIWSFDTRVVDVYRDLDLVDVGRRNGTPIYLEWMQPLGIYYGCTATLAHKATPLGSITLFRAEQDGDFTDSELEILCQIARHLSLHLHQLLPHGYAEGADESPASVLAIKAALLPREAEVLKFMLTGKTNHEIAVELYISESTVKKHVNAIYRKLGVKNRMGLMALLQP